MDTSFPVNIIPAETLVPAQIPLPATSSQPPAKEEEVKVALLPQPTEPSPAEQRKNSVNVEQFPQTQTDKKSQQQRSRLSSQSLSDGDESNTNGKPNALGHAGGGRVYAGCAEQRIFFGQFTGLDELNTSIDSIMWLIYSSPILSPNAFPLPDPVANAKNSKQKPSELNTLELQINGCKLLDHKIMTKIHFGKKQFVFELQEKEKDPPAQTLPPAQQGATGTAQQTPAQTQPPASAVDKKKIEIPFKDIHNISIQTEQNTIKVRNKPEKMSRVAESLSSKRGSVRGKIALENGRRYCRRGDGVMGEFDEKGGEANFLN